MSGVFRKWQPRYAEQGIATFPVKDKKPGIKGWQHIGLKGSAQVAKKLDADALGFNCGPRSGITLVDIDSPDPRIIAEAERVFGTSPVMWRTGNGNYAMPFRHNGERRLIKPISGLPIDLLGGGYAVAPPSVGAKGEYEIIRGTLDDLASLPPIHTVLDSLRRANTPIPEGKRGDELFRFALEQAPYVDDLNGLFDVVLTRNADCVPPMGEDAVIRAAMSAWKYEQEGRNLIGRGAAVINDHGVIDSLKSYPYALALLNIVKRHHWGRDFVLANAMAEGLGWPRRAFVHARNKLTELGQIVEVKPKGRRTPALYRLNQALPYLVSNKKHTPLSPRGSRGRK
jgi:hypothetical protein